MKKFIFIISMLFFTSISNAQSTFQKTYGCTGYSECYSFQQTADGGFIMAGQTDLGAGVWDFYLIKIDSNYIIQWTKTYGGTGYDVGTYVQQTADSGFIFVGFGESFGVGGFNFYLIKTDPIGNLLWTKTFGGGPFDIYCDAVQQTTDGGYILTGDIGGSIGDYDVYLIKTDANGDTLWTKNYGGVNDDDGYFVEQTNDGGYIITGETYSFGAGDYDVYLIKTDSIGNLLWSKTFGGTGDDEGRCVRQTTDGGYIVVGYKEKGSAVIDLDVYLIKTDSSGNLLWSKTFDVLGDDVGLDVKQTTDGGYIISGGVDLFDYDACLIKTDSNGNLLWSKTFGGTDDDVSFSVQQTSDEGYIIAGSTLSFAATAFGCDIYLIKTDSLGNSGCNEGNPSTIVIAPTAQVTSPPTMVGFPPTAITSPSLIVGNGGTVTTLCTNVGINEVENINSFTVYPNPSLGDFIISFEGTITKGKIEIVNIFGENVFRENIFNASKKEINLENISAGIYFVKVFDGEKSYCKKLIIEHD